MLRAFKATDFDTLSLWVTSEALLLQFSASTFSYPLQYPDLEAYITAHPNSKFYIASHYEYGDYGLGEIMEPNSSTPQLGLLLLGGYKTRGIGMVKKLICFLFDECRKNYNATGAELYVLSDNQTAIHCYQSMGFYFLDDEQPIILNDVVKTMKKMRVNF